MFKNNGVWSLHTAEVHGGLKSGLLVLVLSDESFIHAIYSPNGVTGMHGAKLLQNQWRLD